MSVGKASVRLGSKATGRKVLSKVPSPSPLSSGVSAPSPQSSPLLGAMSTTSSKGLSTPPPNATSGAMTAKSNSSPPKSGGAKKVKNLG